MECPNCSASLVDGANFCHVCGAEAGSGRRKPGDVPDNGPVVDVLSRLGPRKYLDHLMAGRSGLSGERRIVSTLFVDVVDSTGMTEKLDPEDVTAIMNGAFRVLAKPVEQFDGTIARLMGDAMLCLFGAPVTHEDDPSRACRTGLAMVSAIRDFAASVRDRYGLASFDIRVGISTGLAVVGEVGTEARAEYTAMGDSVNLASRLQHAARPGSVLICEETRKQVDHSFEIQDGGTLAVRGKSAPVHVFEIRTASQDGFPSGVGGTIRPLIGRERELELFRQSLSALQNGAGGIVAVIGDPGIGKTRLIREARQQAAGDIQWSVGRCTPLSEKNSYAACRNILHDLLGADDGTELHSISEVLRHSIGALSVGQGDNLYALIGKMLRIPLAEKDERQLLSLDPADIPDRMREAFCQYVALRCRERGCVVIWEDAHWMDAESIRALKELAELTAGHPLLIVILCRRETSSVSELISDFERRYSRSLQRIDLGPLQRGEVEQMVRNYLPPENVPDTFVESIAAATDGNPFFLSEILQQVTESGRPEKMEGASPQASSHSFNLPRSVQAAILSRADRLDYHCRRILQSTSVLGRYFRKDVLLEMIRGEMDHTQAEQAFDALVRRQFIERIDRSLRGTSAGGNAAPATEGNHLRATAATDLHYQLVHAMTLEVIYNSLLKSDRKKMHRQAGEATESIAGDEPGEYALSLADHFERAEVWDKALRYRVLAADAALEVFALAHALDGYRLAQDMWRKADIDAPMLVRIHEGMGDVFYFMSDYRNAVDHLDRALHEERNAHHKIILHRKKGRVLEKWGRYDSAKESFEAGLDLMAEGFDEREAGRIYAGLCLIYYHLRDIENAIELGNLALLMMRNHGDELDVAQACNNLGVVYRQKGEPDESIRYFEQGLEILDRSGNAYSRAACHNNIGLVALEQRAFSKAADHFNESVALFEKLGNQHGLARAYDNLGQLYFEMGRKEQSQEYLEKAVGILARIGGGGIDQDPDIWQSGIW